MGQITNPDRVVFCAQTRISRRSSGLRSLRYVGHLPSSGDATRRPIGPGMTNWHCRDLTGAFCRIRATPGGAGARGLPSIQTMPDTEITEECRALIASVFEPPSGRRLPNGNWRTEIDTATWQWLQRLRLQGESISDCIIRIVIIALHRRGLQ